MSLSRPRLAARTAEASDGAVGAIALERQRTGATARGRTADRDDGEQPDEEERRRRAIAHPTPHLVRADSAGMLRRVTTTDQRPPTGRRRGQPPRGDPRRACPDLRLLTEPIDRESYRLDETPYLRAGLPRRRRASRRRPPRSPSSSGSPPSSASRSSRAAPERACRAARPASRAA